VAVTLPCPAEHWPLFSTLLDEALALPEPARGPWLDNLDGDRATLRPWLARVLSGKSAPENERFLAALAPLDDDAGFRAGDVIGPYRLTQKLGEGGMGEVWLADRADEGPRRQVALKLPHAFMLGPAARARFQRERDVVAALSHPNIAQLYEAGVTAAGLPYLALEYVDGTPVTEWCQVQALPLDRRLALVQQILDALGYAHRRLIVHRDIKPSNALVTADGQVKLLDFGIAKLLGEAAETGGLTQPAARLATPDYAAPEQLLGEAVTVSTDLFAVGAVLFQLVAGIRPFSPGRRDPAEEAQLASSRADAAAAGNPLGKRLAGALRGDLDAIIAKALAPDPAQRYPSADAFARDLGRFRAGLPVSARRVGWATRAGKFVRRQRLASALAASFVLAVAAGIGGVAWQAERAERAAARANVIKNFLVGVFQSGDPRAPHDKPREQATAKELLDAAVARLDTGFAGDRETELDILATLGDIYEFMEDVPRAEAIEARRVDLARKLYGPNHPIVLRGMLDQAFGDSSFDEFEKAKILLTAIRYRIPATFGARSHERGIWLMDWAIALRATPGARDERRQDLTAAADILAAESPPPEDYPVVLQELGDVDMDSNRFSQALKDFEAATAFDKAHGEFDPVEEMLDNAHTAEALQNLGKADEAGRRYRMTAPLAERAMGRHSSMYLLDMALLANLLHLRGDRDNADRIFQLLSAGMEGVKTPPGAAAIIGEFYGAALVAEGRSTEALPKLTEALAQDEALPPRVGDQPRIEQALGDADEQLGRRDAAGPLLAAARAAWMREGPPDAPWVLGARERWARFMLAGGNAATAAAECQAILAAAGGTPSSPMALAQADLARMALGRGDVGGAGAFSTAAVRTLNAATGLYDVRSEVLVWRARAASLAMAGDAAGAADWAKRADDAARRFGAP
jgi:serine/threonine-protein kinase